MADQERDKKARVVKNMIETLNSQKSSKFHVMLLRKKAAKPPSIQQRSDNPRSVGDLLVPPG
jgi:hypothetical protein